MQGIKDIGSMFSSSSDKDDSTLPIDPEIIYSDPLKFYSLSLLHQGQICDELQNAYDKKWTRLTDKQKRLGYYIAYGNWDVREKFDNWKDPNSPPYDLPFTVPPIISTIKPTKDTVVKRLPPVDLSKTPVRAEQFATNKMDGVSRFFIYLTLIILMAAIYRDKNIGEEGKPKSTDVADPYYEKVEEVVPFVEPPRKKWYWLYLK